jgi:hypothetical protein
VRRRLLQRFLQRSKENLANSLVFRRFFESYKGHFGRNTLALSSDRSTVSQSYGMPLYLPPGIGTLNGDGFFSPWVVQATTSKSLSTISSVGVTCSPCRINLIVKPGWLLRKFLGKSLQVGTCHVSGRSCGWRSAPARITGPPSRRWSHPSRRRSFSARSRKRHARSRSWPLRENDLP